MKAPLFVRMLSPDEQAKIEAGLRSCDAFTLSIQATFGGLGRETQTHAKAETEAVYTGSVYTSNRASDAAWHHTFLLMGVWLTDF
ncbi:hypothetical protein [Ktedonospora formicarum]|uniref:Uncharacterized protein n=1 Tax=Ktedonospora formicarum TaxID=2778364 RepID=A0A8J3I5J4_9CHLR|nr:hypothetical protein [Ktedonospora formicarum]GHO47160.1 hypothetical protein KSX_53230 [Ktedonospora formicarum]